MPRLPTPKHPEFSRRNEMLVACFFAEGVEAAMEKFDLCRRRVFGIVSEYNPKAKTFKRIRATEIQWILALYQRHKSMAKVARLVGRNRTSVKRLLKRLGVKRFRSGWKGHK
jgi:transcriptional regulator with GAF, ATPase, and Fis domain